MTTTFSLLSSRIGFFLTFVHFTLVIVNALQLTVWFLLFFLACYSISNRISTLASFIESSGNYSSLQDVTVVLPDDILVKKLRTCARLVDQICHSANELNSTFSLPVLMIITKLLIFSTTSLFLFIYLLTTPSDILHKNFITGAPYVPIAFFAGSVFMVLLILIPTGFPIKKVRIMYLY